MSKTILVTGKHYRLRGEGFYYTIEKRYFFFFWENYVDVLGSFKLALDTYNKFESL